MIFSVPFAVFGNSGTQFEKPGCRGQHITPGVETDREAFTQHFEIKLQVELKRLSWPESTPSSGTYLFGLNKLFNMLSHV